MSTVQHHDPAAYVDGKGSYAFGPFVLDFGNRILYRAGLPVEMPAKVFEILRCLVSRRDRLVSKEALVEDVWDGFPIGDNNIAQHMHLVRLALNDLSKPHRYITTVHGRGYRFAGEIRKVESPDPPAPLAANLVPESLATELASNGAFFAKIGTPAALESCLHLCRKALDLYPAFADAHAEMALAALLKAAYLFAVPMQQYDVARRHAMEALRIDPQCARAHLAIAALAILDERTPDAAELHLKAAAVMAPDLPEIAVLRIVALTAKHDYDGARQTAQQALGRHPASSAIASYAAFAAYHAGDVEGASGTLERLLVFRPGAPLATFLLGLCRISQGRYVEARDAFQTLIAGRVSLVSGYEKFRQRAIAALSFVEARTGSAEEAKALARDVQRSEHCSYAALAIVRAGAREEESMIACVREAGAQRDPWFPFMRSDPLFAEYRDTPEFDRATSLI